jgi:hypothetical protein
MNKTYTSFLVTFAVAILAILSLDKNNNTHWRAEARH